MEAIIAKQLEKRSASKINRMSYYESVPLNQIHIDTFFYDNNMIKYTKPVLMIVDIATRYVNIIPQERKNDSIVNHVKNFCEEVRTAFPESVEENSKVTIITDGAKEFNVLKKDFNHKLSVGINKAAVAESYIGITKRMIRKVYVGHYIKHMFKGKVKSLPSDSFKEIIKTIQDEINKKAAIIEIPEMLEKDYDSPFHLGQPVFIKNNTKFYEQLRKLKKKSYLLNYIEEPFFISDVVFHMGLFKYAVTSFVDFSVDIHWHYPEEIQAIEPSVAREYVKAYKTAYLPEKKKSRKKSIF